MRRLARRSWMWNRRSRLCILVGVTLAVSAALWFVPRIPLGLGYHDFADQRTILGIRHALDVLSNVPFFVVGLWGIILVFRRVQNPVFRESRERIPYFVFFAGVALTGIGSGYYHLAPGNSRLAWDLLPMTISFVSIVDATIVERISVRAGVRLLVPLMALGSASVAYWYISELQAHGDLRFYLAVQFLPVLAIAMMVALFPARYDRTKDLIVAFALCVLAKLFELLDKQIYSLGGFVSGHTLKHLTAGLACYWILRMLELRGVVDDSTTQRQARPAGMETAGRETSSLRLS